MIRLRHKLFIHLLRGVDQLTWVVCLALVTRSERGGRHLVELGALAGPYELRTLMVALILVLSSALLFNHFVRYESDRFTAFTDQVFGVLKAVTATAFLVLAAGVLLGVPRLTPRGVLVFWSLAVFSASLSRLVVRQLLMFSRRSGMTTRRLLIVGANQRACALAARFEACPELGYRILGFVAEEKPNASSPAEAGSRILGTLADLKGLLQQSSVDEMLICLPVAPHFTWISESVRLGEQLGIVVRVIPDIQEATLLRRMQLESFEGQFVLTFFREGLLFQLMLKRMLDVGVSLFLLVLLSPLMILVAFMIKAGSPGPVFFVQERVGMNRRRFRLYKFRSMGVDAEIRKLEFARLNEMDGPVFKIANDPRVTRFGRLIRKASIDELPQLLNVLVGEMSLVGPRPPLPSEVEQYEWLFQRRLSIKPGITCLWQVSGRNRIPFREWMELDKQYVQNWSLWLDLKILARTLPVVLFGRGAS